MKRLALVAVVVTAACGGGGGGEDITGDIVIDYGDTHVVPDTGAVVEDPDNPGEVYLGIGNLGLGCDFLQARIHPGDAFVAVHLDATMQTAGDYSTLILVTFADDTGTHLNGSTGTLTLTGFGERVTGSMSMSTTDDDVGPVSTSGSFDVFSCL